MVLEPPGCDRDHREAQGRDHVDRREIAHRAMAAVLAASVAASRWGDAVVDDLATAIAQRYPGLRGYTRRNLFRMRQFFCCHNCLGPITSSF